METTMTTANKIEWTTETRTGTTRQLAKCAKCKVARNRMVSWTNKRTYRSDQIGYVSNVTRYEGDTAVECCGRVLHFKAINGTFNPEKKCNAKCLNSTSHICECSCGGKNHGAGH